MKFIMSKLVNLFTHNLGQWYLLMENWEIQSIRRSMDWKSISSCNIILLIFQIKKDLKEALSNCFPFQLQIRDNQARQNRKSELPSAMPVLPTYIFHSIRPMHECLRFNERRLVAKCD